ARRTAVTEQAHTSHDCRQQGHAMQGDMVLEHLLQHRIRGGFLRGGECGHELSVLYTMENARRGSTSSARYAGALAWALPASRVVRRTMACIAPDDLTAPPRV